MSQRLAFVADWRRAERGHAAVVGISLFAAPGVDGVFGVLLVALMLAIAIIDRRAYIIPDPPTAAPSRWRCCAP